MRFAAGILVAMVTAWMVWRGHRRGATDILTGVLPLGAAIATAAVLGRLDSIMIGGVVIGALLIFCSALAVFLVVRKTLVAYRKKRPVRAGRINRAAGAALGLVLASYLCLIVAEVGSTIVFCMTLTAPEKNRDPLAPIDADPTQWVDSLRDFCSATADFSATGLLRHVPYAGQYAQEVRSLVKILNASREDLARIARKRKLLDLANIPEIHRAFNDPGYRALLLRARQGDLKSLYEMAESPITRELFTCREIREFASKLKPSDLLEDMKPQEHPMTGKQNLKTPDAIAHKSPPTPPKSSVVSRSTKPGVK